MGKAGFRLLTVPRNLPEETYQKALKACLKYDKRWTVKEIDRNNLWYKAFHDPTTLPAMAKEILESAQQEQGTDCRVFGEARKKWPFFGIEEYAYRIVAYALHGWPPQSKKHEVVRHLCSNSYCVNPDHLKVGTPHENIVDDYWVQAGKYGAIDDKTPPRDLEREPVFATKPNWLDPENSPSLKKSADMRIPSRKNKDPRKL